MSLAKYLARSKAIGLGKDVGAHAIAGIMRGAAKHPRIASALGGAALGASIDHDHAMGGESEEDDEHERRMRELGL